MMSAQGGSTPKADAVRKLSKGGCVKMQTRGEGVKKSEKFADVICTWPLGSAKWKTEGCFLNDILNKEVKSIFIKEVNSIIKAI